MELNKIAQYQAKNEPYLKPISDLGIGFYNLDENTATLQFRIYNNDGPLLISDENVDVHGYFESSNGSVSTVLNLEVVDGMNGIAQITLDKDFLQASTSTKVTGQIYVAVNNDTDNPNNNQTAVLGEFTFQVADALINKVSSFTKVEYIRMFDQLREEIKQRTLKMEKDIGNIETLVHEVKNTVYEGQKELTAIGNQTIIEINKIAQQSDEAVKQYANQAITDIQTTVDSYQTKLSNDTKDKINQVNAASDKVLKTIEQNNAVTTSQTAEWQKYKLTTDNGILKNVMKVDFNEPENTLGNGGIFYGMQCINQPQGEQPFGNVIYQKREAVNSSHEKIYFTPYNNNNQYIRTKTIGVWGKWQVIGPSKDTGWLPLTLKNSYKNSTTPDFEPSYRVVDHGGYKQVYVRLGVENITNGKNVVAMIPKEFAPNKIYSLGVSTNVKIPPKVIISGGDIEFHTNEADNYATTDYIIYQDSWIV